jgi:Recombinase
MWRMTKAGHGDTRIARTLNARGITTRAGKPWTRGGVQAILINPFYCGRIVHHGETFEGKHPRYVEPADLDRPMAARAERDLGRGRHTVGRPAKRHALQRLAVCGHCGRRMVSFTSALSRWPRDRRGSGRSAAWSRPCAQARRSTPPTSTARCWPSSSTCSPLRGVDRPHRRPPARRAREAGSAP